MACVGSQLWLAVDDVSAVQGVSRRCNQSRGKQRPTSWRSHSCRQPPAGKSAGGRPLEILVAGPCSAETTSKVGRRRKTPPAPESISAPTGASEWSLGNARRASTTEPLTEFKRTTEPLSELKRTPHKYASFAEDLKQCVATPGVSPGELLASSARFDCKRMTSAVRAASAPHQQRQRHVRFDAHVEVHEISPRKQASRQHTLRFFRDVMPLAYQGSKSFPTVYTERRGEDFAAFSCEEESKLLRAVLASAVSPVGDGIRPRLPNIKTAGNYAHAFRDIEGATGSGHISVI